MNERDGSPVEKSLGAGTPLPDVVPSESSSYGTLTPPDPKALAERLLATQSPMTGNAVVSEVLLSEILAALRAAADSVMICGAIADRGPNGEPLACAYRPISRGEPMHTHSWTTLPTWATLTADVLRRVVAAVPGTCDWGGCDDPALLARFDEQRGEWLPVCQWHAADASSDYLAPITAIPFVAEYAALPPAAAREEAREEADRLRAALEWINHACDMDLAVMRETFGSEQRLLLAVIPSKIRAALGDAS